MLREIKEKALNGVACGRDRALVERLGFKPHGFLRARP